MVNKELENLLKLKQEIIKDLKKKGKVVENANTRKRIELSDRIKKREERILTVDFSQVEIIRDIDSQDYDAPDFLIIEKLKSFLNSVKDTRKVEFLIGLLRIFEFKFEESLNIFQNYAFDGDSKAAYNYAETLLFLGKYNEALGFISQFTKAFKPDLYTYLSILEILVYFFKGWERIEKVFGFFKNSNDIFSKILRVGYLLSKQNLDEANSEFSKVVVSGKYKNLLDIYSMVINKNMGNVDKTAQIANSILKRSKEHTCSFVHAHYSKERNYSFDLEKLAFCPYARFLMAKKAFLNANFKAAFSQLEPLLKQNYPSALALAGVIKMFQEDFDSADSYWIKLSKLVPFEISVGTLKNSPRSNVEKLSNDIDEKKRLQTINMGTSRTLNEILKSSTNMGFKLMYPELEFLRLFFGERTCKRMYGKE